MYSILKNIKYDEHVYEIFYNEDTGDSLLIYDERGIKCRNKDIKLEIVSAALINALYKVEYLEKFRDRTHIIFEDFDKFATVLDNSVEEVKNKLYDLDYEIEDCCRIEAEDKEYE